MIDLICLLGEEAATPNTTAAAITFMQLMIMAMPLENPAEDRPYFVQHLSSKTIFETHQPDSQKKYRFKNSLVPNYIPEKNKYIFLEKQKFPPNHQGDQPSGGYGKVRQNRSLFFLEAGKLHYKPANNVIKSMKCPKNADRELFYSIVMKEYTIAKEVYPATMAPSFIYDPADPETIVKAYLPLPFIEGEDLLDYVNTQDTLPLAVALKISLNLIEALAALHAKSIVHGDIKFENIRINPNTFDVFFIDFGFSFFENDEENIHTCGTPGYLPPELCRKEISTYPRDIYSLGIVIVSLLSGYHMVKDHSEFEPYLRTINNSQTPPLHNSLFENALNCLSANCSNNAILYQNILLIVTNMLVYDPQQRANSHQLLDFCKTNFPAHFNQVEMETAPEHINEVSPSFS